MRNDLHIFFCCTVILICGVLGCRIIDADTDGVPLRMRLYSNKDTYRKGEPIIVWLELSNSSTNPVAYLDISRDVSFLANYLVIRVKDDHSSEVMPNGPIIDPPPLELDDVKTLNPGEHLTLPLGDLGDDHRYRFWRFGLGTYTIDAKLINAVPPNPQNPIIFQSNVKSIAIKE